MRQGINEEAEDSYRQELEERMLQIEEGDRSNPKVVELDTLAAELEERERHGLLAEAIFHPDWRTELGEGEEIFVKHPDGMEHFLKKMRIRMLMKSERAEKVRDLADKLLQDRIIAIPLQVCHYEAHTPAMKHTHLRIGTRARTHARTLTRTVLMRISKMLSGACRSGRREMPTQTGSQTPRRS